MTFYTILEVSEDASEEVIRMAYKGLVKKYHPDVYTGDAKEAEKKMQKINRAYEVLSDATSRKEYDEKLQKEREMNEDETENQEESNDAVHNNKNQSSINPLVGKKYDFVSVRGTNMLAVFNTRITSEIEFGEDRIKISIKPKRYNKSPIILLEDILSIEMATRINGYIWFWIIVSVLVALANSSVFWLIGAAILIWLGRNRKIRIIQRNGNDVIIYSRNKELAEEFIADIKKIAKSCS